MAELNAMASSQLSLYAHFLVLSAQLIPYLIDKLSKILNNQRRKAR